MLKKTISLLLCAVLAFSLCTFALPQKALAAAPEVWVGGTDVSAGGYWRNDGNGGITPADASNYNVHYASGTGILTLNGATITKSHHDASVAYAAIYANILAASTLTTTLNGTNSVTGTATNGSNPTAGIYVKGGKLTINGSGNLTSQGGPSMNTNRFSCGIYGSNDVTIASGTVNATGGAATYTDAESYGLSCEGVLSISGGTLNATGGAAGAKSYGLSGTTITISTGSTIAATGGMVENNSPGGGARNDNSSGMHGSVEIYGGTVNATGGTAKDGNSIGIYCENARHHVNIYGGTVNATGATSDTYGSLGIFSQRGTVAISGGTVNATGGTGRESSYGVLAAYGISISGGTVTATGGTANSNESFGIDAMGLSISITGGTVTAKGNLHALIMPPDIFAYPFDSATITASTDITGASAVPYSSGDIDSYKYFRIAPQRPVSIGSNLMTATAMETSYYTNGANNGSSYDVGTVVTKGKTESAPDGWNAKLELENGEYVLTLKGLMLTAARGIQSDVNLKLLLDTTAAGSNIVSNGTAPAVDVNGDLDLLTTSTAGSGLATLDVTANGADAVKVNGNLTLDGESILSATTNAQGHCGINVGQNLTVGEKCQLSGQTHATQGAQTCGVKAGGNVVMNGSSLTCHSTSGTGLEAGGGITLNSGDIDLNGSDKALNKEPDLSSHPRYVWQAETNPFALAPYIYSDTHKRLVIAAVPSATIGDVTVSGTVGSAISTTTAIAITLKDDTFNNSLSASDDISGWFTNIPSGISAKLNATPSGNDAWVIFSGTPTTASTAPMTVTIPADVLDKGLALTVTSNANAKWSISAPPSAGGSGGGSSDVTVYNDPVKPKATVWLTGSGLDNSDLLITERDPQGSAYNALLRLADSDDVFATYNISLRSGKKSTGSAMNLTFDLGSDYAGQAFTLVHQKADGTYEYFYTTADYFGDLNFGPLYELSPFMLVHGKLAQTAYANFTDMPKTGDSAQPALVTCAVLLMAAASIAGFSLRKRHD